MAEIENDVKTYNEEVKIAKTKNDSLRLDIKKFGENIKKAAKNLEDFEKIKNMSFWKYVKQNYIKDLILHNKKITAIILIILILIVVF